MLILFVNGKEIMRMSRAHLPFHTPSRTGERRWMIVEASTGEIIDSYAPARPARPQPTTPYVGSWAWEQEAQRGAAAA